MDELAKYAVESFYLRASAPEPNDVGYAYFLVYNRRLVYRLATRALNEVTVGDKSDVAPLRILDLGCGTGEHLDYLLRWGPQTLREPGTAPIVRGIDANEGALRLARARFMQLGVRADFIFGDVSAPLPFATDSFDLAFCTEVLQYLNRPEELLGELGRVLRPGGLCVVTAANDPTLQGALRRVVHRRAQSPPRAPRDVVQIEGARVELFGSVSGRSVRQWERTLAAAGFEVVSLGSYECVRRHTTGAGRFALMLFFLANFAVSFLPARIGRRFGATSAMLVRNRNETS